VFSKRILIQLNIFKEVIDKITGLDYQKKQAITAEDYDSAKMIKYQIENLIDQALNNGI